MTVPKPPENKYAVEGVNAHSCLEFLLNNWHRHLEAVDMAKKRWPLQMVIDADMTFNYIRSRMSTPELKGAELLVEKKVFLPVDEPNQFGTADIVIVQEFDRLIVKDYKYGAGIPVEVKENSQLIYYALATAHLYHYNFIDVELTVIQPRRAMDGELIRSWVTSMDYIMSWREIFNEGIRAAQAKKPKFRAGAHCRFCPAKNVCPEYEHVELRQAQDAFSESL